MSLSSIVRIAICAFALLTGAVGASVFQSEEQVDISRLHTIDDDFFAAGNNFNMDGTITGDVLVFMYRSDINGEINGSIFSFSRFFRFNGAVDGSIRAFAQTATISGYVGRSLEIACESFDLASGAVVGRDASIAGGDIRIDGTIRGTARLTAEQIRINGSIEGDVILDAERITIAPPAVIQGNLSYTTAKKEDIVIEPGVTIVGETTWIEPSVAADSGSKSSFFTEFILRLSSLLAAFIFGIIVVRLFRPYAEESLSQIRNHIGSSLAAGTAGVFVLAGCIAVLLTAVAAILAGLILIGSNELAVLGGPLLIVSILLVPISSFVSVSGGIIFYSGKIIVAFVIGGMVRGAASKDNPLRALPLLIGLVALTILFTIPYLGTLCYLAATIVGAGAIILGIKNCPRNRALARPESKATPMSPNSNQA